MTYKVAITGEFRRGKDTLANLIEEQLTSPPVLARFSFAYALKREVANMVDDYLGRGDPNPDATHAMLHRRDLMGQAWQWWGEFRRGQYGDDYWIKELELAYDGFRLGNPDGAVLITDMRHHNEAEWCKEHGFFLIRITGPCRAEGEKRDPNHPSEVHVRELPVHLQIQNTGGLDALRECVKTRVMPRLKEFFDARVPG